MENHNKDSFLKQLSESQKSKNKKDRDLKNETLLRVNEGSICIKNENLIEFDESLNEMSLNGSGDTKLNFFPDLKEAPWKLYTCSQSSLFQIPVLSPNELQLQISQEAQMVEATISKMTMDFERFGTPPNESSSLTPAPPQIITQTIDKNVSSSHTSLIDRSLSVNRRRNESPRKLAQNTTPKLLKCSNLAEENSMLSKTLKEEIERSKIRKGVCSFMYGALKKQGERIITLETKNKGKKEETAARVILHSLLLNAYRKSQGVVGELANQNSQLQKSVENLCLQLRVVRHLQSAEKERAIEKAHEIGSLKNEVAFVKKMLNKTKSELEKLENDCEDLHRSSQQMSEEKTRLHREFRSFEDYKQDLQRSLDLERKNSEKHLSESRRLKKQLIALKTQLAEINLEKDKWEESGKGHEAKNWQLQMELEGKGKELEDLGRTRQLLTRQTNELKIENTVLSKQNEILETQLRKNEKEVIEAKKLFSSAQAQLKSQELKIKTLETEIDRVERESDFMKKELLNYKLRNIRKRRAWANLAASVLNPFETLINVCLGGSIENSCSYDFPTII